MLRKENIIVVFVGALLLTLGVGYAVYINPLGDGDKIHESTISDLPVHIELPITFDAQVTNLDTSLTVKGTKEMVKNTDHLSPVIYGEVEAYVGEQIVALDVQGVDGYIYELQQDEVTVQVTEVEPELVKPKVVVRGKPEKKIKRLEVVDDIEGYFNSNTMKEFGEVLIIIQVDGLKENTTVVGEVVVEDIYEGTMDSSIVDKEEVEVEVIVD